jgi:hypothetical protein
LFPAVSLGRLQGEQSALGNLSDDISIQPPLFCKQNTAVNLSAQHAVDTVIEKPSYYPSLTPVSRPFNIEIALPKSELTSAPIFRSFS